jgi:beta-lactamase class A
VSAQKQRIDKTLQKKTQNLLQNFKGDAGVFIKKFKVRQSCQLMKIQFFLRPAWVKIPILVGIMDKIEKGELSITIQNGSFQKICIVLKFLKVVSKELSQRILNI